MWLSLNLSNCGGLVSVYTTRAFTVHASPVAVYIGGDVIEGMIESSRWTNAPPSGVVLPVD